MLRDGVCDEASNNEKCLFDGGDCCLENKDRDLCKDCTCQMTVDEVELANQFSALDIKPVKDPPRLEAAIEITNGWALVVEDVVSLPVCAMVCLEHKDSDKLNTWHYQFNERLCKCGWVHSSNCPEKMAKSNWTLAATGTGGLFADNISNETRQDVSTIVQMNKTVPCDCLVSSMLINSDISENAKVDYGNEKLYTPSLWHCQQLCRDYEDCTWVSWNSVANDGSDLESGMYLV